MNDAEISREVARQAAHWLMLLHSGEAGPEQVRECQRWRQACAEHEQAWQRVRQVQERLGLLPPALAMGALGRERRQVLKTLLSLAVLAPLGYAGYRLGERQQWLADQRTAVGQRRTLDLADGSHLSLNSDSAVDLLFSEHERLIRLRRGEILLDSGSDAGHPGHRPLRVETAQGRLQALGTRFLVRRFDERALTRVAVFEGAVRVEPRQGGSAVVAAGEQLSFSADAVGTPSAVSEELAGWVHGQLIAEDMQLDEFLAELARHRNGWLRCAPEVANLRISGTFQLDNSTAILAALPATLPVTVHSHTRYWIRVGARE